MWFERKDHRMNPLVINILLAAGIFFILILFCRIMQYSLMIPLLLLFAGLHLVIIKKANRRTFLHLGFLLTLLVFTAHFLLKLTDLSPHFIPVASVALLTTLLFNDLLLSFMMSFLSSMIVCLIIGADFGIMLTFLFGSLKGTYAVKGARTRGQLLAAGLFISSVHIICLYFLYPDYEVIKTRVFEVYYLWPMAANGFISAFLVAASLKIFESLFGVLTNYSLLELSDFNQPLLKRMILEAPGTYHHSLVVSNLAEAAADAIGANTMLTRVGAYYHDIGKLDKPEYFTENQMMGHNKHDGIEPSMSRLVILNHVKEGIELAKKYKLNPVIADFIAQHHGTSLIYYFYQKSLEGAENGEKIPEENYRYPGPRPQTKELAIVLMADSVEGATRSLEEHTPNRIEETVKKIVNNKFIDGQLDDCNLTLKEVNRISETFIRILNAMYHTRVKYPEKKNGDNPKKPPEKNTAESPQDQNNSENNSQT